MKGNWARASFGGIATVVGGYYIMKWATPSDEEFYAKLSPELKKKVDMHRDAAQRRMTLAQKLEEVREERQEESPLLPSKKK